MHRISCFSQSILLVVLGVGIVRADTLVLHSGKTLNGTFLGGSTRQVDFLPDSGQAVTVPIGDVKSLTIASAPSAAAPAKQKRPGVMIPAGTGFRIRTVDLIDVDSSQAGMKFRASLDDPIMSGGAVVAPRGADVVLVASKVQQGGKMKGSDLIEMKVNSITIGGRVYPVVTSLSETKSAGEGKKTSRKILGGAGLGAIVGGIAGGGTGAAIGAAVGGVAGTAVAASGQPHLKIPAETRLDFQLIADLKVN